MGYRVIKDFSDSTDNKYVYRAGDPFPRPGAEVSSERIKGLLGTDNKQGVPLITEDASLAEEVPSEIDTGRKPVRQRRSQRKDTERTEEAC